MAQDLHQGQHAVRMAHEQLEQSPLPRGQFDALSGSPGYFRGKVQHEIGDGELVGGLLVPGPQRRPDPSKQLHVSLAVFTLVFTALHVVVLATAPTGGTSRAHLL